MLKLCLIYTNYPNLKILFEFDDILVHSVNIVLPLILALKFNVRRKEV